MSPIHGLTERRRLPRLGKIHLGVKVANAKGVSYPKAVDYFVVPPEVAKFHGEKPKQLPIMFPINDEEAFASQYYRAYTRTRGLVCKGDGISANRMIDEATKTADPETGEITGAIATAQAKEIEWVQNITCPGTHCPYYEKGECREIMNLQFLLPQVPGLGIWQLDTSSYNSILNVNSSLALIRQIFGTVAGIPLYLTVEPTEVSPDGKKKTVYILNVRSPATLGQLARTKGQPMIALLPQGDDEIPDLLFPTPEQVQARKEAEQAPEQGTSQAPESSSTEKPAEVKHDARWFVEELDRLQIPQAKVTEVLGMKTADWLKQHPGKTFEDIITTVDVVVYGAKEQSQLP